MLNVLELRLENEPRYELANVSVCEVLSAKDNIVLEVIAVEEALELDNAVEGVAAEIAELMGLLVNESDPETFGVGELQGNEDGLEIDRLCEVSMLEIEASKLDVELKISIAALEDDPTLVPMLYPLLVGPVLSIDGLDEIFDTNLEPSSLVPELDGTEIDGELRMVVSEALEMIVLEKIAVSRFESEFDTDATDDDPAELSIRLIDVDGIEDTLPSTKLDGPLKRLLVREDDTDPRSEELIVVESPPSVDFPDVVVLKIETDSFEVVETIEFVDVSELEGGLEFSEAAKLLKVLEVVMPLDIADSLPIDWLELSIILLDPVMVAEGLIAADNKPESVAELLLKISIEDG
ncbi:MAG: hypothetical protein MMC23_002774 [Stictis urceolatum]|nr:hypothetical protein [Stictis urceolata]